MLSYLCQDECSQILDGFRSGAFGADKPGPAWNEMNYGQKVLDSIFTRIATMKLLFDARVRLDLSRDKLKPSRQLEYITQSQVVDFGKGSYKNDDVTAQ